MVVVMLRESAFNGVNCDTNQASPRKLGSLYLKVTKNVHDAPVALIAPNVSRLTNTSLQRCIKAKPILLPQWSIKLNENKEFLNKSIRNIIFIIFLVYQST